ncbi:Apoptosis-inducing factor 2 [Rhizoctonia solani AG-1 IB]|uniref:Apoptosis-inducing factor 2 n=1 Tax=Thanatephorus cucumeris (strain AG1-IB / isolate 7/3/14) TaxID=1108050 RepID=M5C5C6_THACB|nr:Apoptosis-inducing factor 2 [Rhizoctonia solani AG-1 IB]
MSTPFVSALKTALVLGGSYGGIAASKFLAKELPEGYRVVLLERNSHANHLYVLPRFSVLPSHEPKAFIPYNNLFGPTPNHHRIIHGTATKLEQNKVTYTPAPYSTTSNETEHSLEFDYLIYALGAKLPGPIDFWAKSVYDVDAEKTVNLDFEKDAGGYDGSKSAAIASLQRAQKRLRTVESVLVVGGGALGIQFASDLKSLYPHKQITLLHSRTRLLPRFPTKMHDEINKTVHSLDVDLILGQRLDLKTTLPENAEYDERGRRVVKTESGKRICADLVLVCTGQIPNTSLMHSFAPRAIDERTGMIKVIRTMQVDVSDSQFVVQDGSTDKTGAILPHIYAIGDAADAFGAIKAGHTAHWQAEVASKNIIASILSRPLTSYEPGPPAIKITLGLRHYATIMGPEQTLTVGDDGKDDLDAVGMWPYVGANFERDRDL